MTLPFALRPSTGTTPESINATSTPLPVQPSFHISPAPIAPSDRYIDPRS